MVPEKSPSLGTYVAAGSGGGAAPASDLLSIMIQVSPD
jgi:hypothetical protein